MPYVHVLVPPSRWLAIVALVLAVAGPGVTSAQAQDAATLYERAQARERSVRAAANAPISTLRSVATAYENIVRRHPRSGYCDNALWQAAGLLQLAWERDGSSRDRDKAVALLDWLEREYPSSSLIAGIPAVLIELDPTPVASDPPAVAHADESPVTTIEEPAPPAAPPPAVAAATALAPVEDEHPAAPPEPSAERRAVPAPRPFPLPGSSVDARPIAATTEDSRRPADDPAAGPPVLESVYFTPLPGGERVTLVLSREAEFASVRTRDPDALVLTFRDVVADAAVVDALQTLSGTFVDGLAVRRDDGQPLQVRLALAGQPRFSTFPLYDPYRLVIDVEGDRSAAAHARATAPDEPWAPPLVVPAASPEPPGERPEPPSSTSLGDYSLARQLGLGVARIVIDPGHGGHDPGARAHSIAEAELVLDIALRLEELLTSQPGFEVVLTRRTDTYVALEERTAMANRAQADLFLSIHANASRNAETRGIETYFLNFATSEEAEAVAARENASSGQAMHILPDILKTIATNDKVAESRELASMVQTSLMRRIGSLSRTIKDLGVKQAPFVVLIGAEMPSVLAEVSFLTNRTEAALLGQAAHRQRIAQALCDAILAYQGSLKKATTVAAHTD